MLFIKMKRKIILILILFVVWLFIYTVPLKGNIQTGALTFLNNSVFTIALMNSPVLLL
jgi:hypothetical protein